MKTKYLFIILVYLISSFSIGQTLITVNIKANKLLYDNTHNLLYATVNSQDTVYGNRLVAINPVSGQIVNSVFMGNQPYSMAITSDHNYLFVGLNDTSIVKKVDLAQFSLVSQINLGVSTSYGPYFAYDLATINNRNDIVIVSRSFIQTGWQQCGGIAMYKNQQMLPNTTGVSSNASPIEFDAKNELLYGYVDIGFPVTTRNLSSFSIDTLQGVNNPFITMFTLTADIKYANKLLFSNFVSDLSVNPPQQLGNFYNSLPAISGFAVTDSATYAYIAGDNSFSHISVSTFDAQTLNEISEEVYTNTITQSGLYDAAEMEDIGLDGFAIIIKNLIYPNAVDQSYSQVFLKPQSVSGMKEFFGNELNLSVGPNPFKDKISLSFGPVDISQSFNVFVTNVHGRKIMSFDSIKRKKVEINVENLEPGIYFVNIEERNTNRRVVKKMIKN